MDLLTAQHRIYAWAKTSPRLEDQVACDTVFAALTELGALRGEVDELRDMYGWDVEDDSPALPQRPDRTED